MTLNHLVAKSGFTMLFDLNTLIRFDNGSWNFLNAETLIEFSDKHNLTIIWELGNGIVAEKENVFLFTVYFFLRARRVSACLQLFCKRNSVG